MATAEQLRTQIQQGRQTIAEAKQQIQSFDPSIQRTQQMLRKTPQGTNQMTQQVRLTEVERRRAIAKEQAAREVSDIEQQFETDVAPIEQQLTELGQSQKEAEQYKNYQRIANQYQKKGDIALYGLGREERKLVKAMSGGTIGEYYERQDTLKQIKNTATQVGVQYDSTNIQATIDKINAKINEINQLEKQKVINERGEVMLPVKYEGVVSAVEQPKGFLEKLDKSLMRKTGELRTKQLRGEITSEEKGQLLGLVIPEKIVSSIIGLKQIITHPIASVKSVPQLPRAIKTYGEEFGENVRTSPETAIGQLIGEAILFKGSGLALKGVSKAAGIPKYEVNVLGRTISAKEIPGGSLVDVEGLATIRQTNLLSNREGLASLRSSSFYQMQPGSENLFTAHSRGVGVLREARVSLPDLSGILKKPKAVFGKPQGFLTESFERGALGPKVLEFPGPYGIKVGVPVEGWNTFGTAKVKALGESAQTKYLSVTAGADVGKKSYSVGVSFPYKKLGPGDFFISNKGTTTSSSVITREPTLTKIYFEPKGKPSKLKGNISPIQSLEGQKLTDIAKALENQKIEQSFKQIAPQIFKSGKKSKVSSSVGIAQVLSKQSESAYYGMGLYERTPSEIVFTKPAQLSLQKDLVSPLENIRQIQFFAPAVKTEQVSPLAHITPNAFKEIERVRQIPRVIPFESLAYKQIQKEALKQRAIQRNANFPVSYTRFKPAVKLIPRSKTKDELMKRSKSLRRLSKAFDVFVRRRGKFKKIFEGLPYGRALLLGSERVKGTLAATFQIKPSAKETSLSDIASRIDPRIFRTPKSKTPLTFVQRSGLKEGGIRTGRLTSRGEKAEIQFMRRIKK